MTIDSVPEMSAVGMTIPDRLVHAIKFLRGADAGHAWLVDLDVRLREYGTRWDLEFEAIAEGGAMSCCAYCYDPARTELVLKVPVDPAAGFTEVSTLDRWSATGVVPRVVQADPATGVFLMERLRPGRTYAGVGDLDDVAAFVQMYGRLAQDGREFGGIAVPHLAEVIGNRFQWAQVRFGDSKIAGKRPDIERAERLAQQLNATAAVQVVHGDLQAKNLLWGPGGKLFCIDPLTAWGDPASDVASWAVLQDSIVPIGVLLARAAEDLAIDPSRLEDWAYVLAIAELRPTQASRFARQSTFITYYENSRG